MARSLVEMLSRAARVHRQCAIDDPESQIVGDHLSLERAYDAAAELAAPYEARRLALEKVFEAATIYVKGECPGTAWTNLQIALAAVPEIPEEP